MALNGDEEIVQQFVLDSENYNIYLQFNTPIVFDNSRYNYYLKILQVQFSNVVPNVETALYAESNLVCDVGIYTVQDVVDNYNSIIKPLIGVEASLDMNNYHIKLTNTLATNTTINGGNLYSSEIFGSFNLSTPLTLTPGQTITSPKIVVVQAYNYFMLSSKNVMGYTSTNRNGVLTPSNCVYTFSSAMDAFQFKTWTAVQPILFKLDGTNVQYIGFEIRDGRDRPITQLMGQSDFSVTAQIIKKLKI